MRFFYFRFHIPCRQACRSILGQAGIIPSLYPSVVDAVQTDLKLYELFRLDLVDALTAGRAREKDLALPELKIRILNGE